jgi:poly(beta-D-mannuronate) lyase
MTKQEKLWGLALIVLAGGILLAFAACTVQTRTVEIALKPPFDISAIRTSVGKKDTAAFECAKPPKAMKDLEFESIYSNLSANSSIVDLEAQAAYREKTAPISRFENQITTMANRYIQSNPPRPEIAACTLDWLKRWAKQNALLGHANATGEQVRKWTLASASLAYLQIKDEKSLNKEDKKIVRQWLRKVSAHVVKDFSEDTDRMSRRNNHLYWAAWSVAVTSVALDDQRSFNWAMNQARIGIAQISAEGTLPLEIARGRKALNYHVYAATPLFLLAEVGLANGINLYAENEGGLHQLADLIMRSADDPSFFEQMTGEKQDMERTVTSTSMGWIEAYNKHYPSEKTEYWIKKLRPFHHSRAGGNTTLLYSH